MAKKGYHQTHKQQGVMEFYSQVCFHLTKLTHEEYTLDEFPQRTLSTEA
jgi:hypothetical protein